MTAKISAQNKATRKAEEVSLGDLLDAVAHGHVDKVNDNIRVGQADFKLSSVKLVVTNTKDDPVEKGEGEGKGEGDGKTE